MWAHSSAGRALRWQRRGQEFDPPWVHQNLYLTIWIYNMKNNKNGQYIDHGKDIDYNDDMDIRDEEAKLIAEVETNQGLKIQIWDVDFQHALEGHPEVSIARIINALKNPIKVVQSKKSNRACLFYNLEIENDPNFGKIYFCVVVGVLGDGKGKMETAYETTFVKTGTVLFEMAHKNGEKK
jgi:hypothetical protein